MKTLPSPSSTRRAARNPATRSDSLTSTCAVTGAEDRSRQAIELLRNTGVDADEVRAQVLTQIEEASLIGTRTAMRIRCDVLTRFREQVDHQSGKPIIGGLDIDKQDFARGIGGTRR